MKELFMDDHGKLKVLGTIVFGAIFIWGFIALSILIG